MTDIAAKLAAFCTSSVSSAILSLIGSFVLPPLAVWDNVPVRTVAVLTSVFGAWTAYFHVKNKRRRLIRWLAALVLLPCAVMFYNGLLNRDPKATNLTWHHREAEFCFFASYLLLGFCSGEACRFLIEFFAKKPGASARGDA